MLEFGQLDFAQLPPEINSGLMYSGPGAGPLRRPGTAWPPNYVPPQRPSGR